MILTLDRQGLADWFNSKLHGIRCSRAARAYITGVLSAGTELESGSIVLAYRDADEQGDFEGFQRIGDSVLWTAVVLPKRFEMFKDVYQSYGRLSYYACYRILRGRWTLYEELADELPRLVDEARSSSFPAVR